MQYRIQNTAAAKLMYIKFPMYLFFYMALGLNAFDEGLFIHPTTEIPSLFFFSVMKSLTLSSKQFFFEYTF